MEAASHRLGHRPKRPSACTTSASPEPSLRRRWPAHRGQQPTEGVGQSPGIERLRQPPSEPVALVVGQHPPRGVAAGRHTDRLGVDVEQVPHGLLSTHSPRDGQVEEMRVLLVARRSAREQRSQTLNQLRHLVFCAPEPIRVRFKDRPKKSLVTEASSMRPRPGGDTIVYRTSLVIRSLARRIQSLDTEKKTIDQTLQSLINQTAPSLLEMHGVGIDTAASLLVAAGDNPDRLRNERSWAHLCGTTPIPASSGKVTRHRLNRGGNRQANAALHCIVVTRMSSHEETRRYVTRRRAEGLSNPEIMRCLKRYVARQTFKHIT